MASVEVEGLLYAHPIILFSPNEMIGWLTCLYLTGHMCQLCKCKS